jgi:hypothetical protein
MNMIRQILSMLLAAGLALSACHGQNKPESKPGDSIQGGKPMALVISSSAFVEGGMIPAKYTCDGQDISPSLSISGIPEKAKSLALISDDPDAPRGTWVHWVLYNLPPDTKELPENMPDDEKLKNGARHAVTDFGSFGYGGPCPPSGTHRYFFKVYALDMVLRLSGKVKKTDVEAAMKGHVLADGQLMGKYKRQ